MARRWNDEFYYEPGATMVYPSVGRLAFLIEPSDVQLHWITDIPHMAVAGLGRRITP